MLHPVLMEDVANLRYQEMLQRAENKQLYKRIKGNQPGLLQRISNRLMAAGQRLQTQSNLATPLWGEK
jgi:hypothetical protein